MRSASRTIRPGRASHRSSLLLAMVDDEVGPLLAHVGHPAPWASESSGVRSVRPAFRIATAAKLKVALIFHFRNVDTRSRDFWETSVG